MTSPWISKWALRWKKEVVCGDRLFTCGKLIFWQFLTVFFLDPSLSLSSLFLPSSSQSSLFSHINHFTRAAHDQDIWQAECGTWPLPQVPKWTHAGEYMTGSNIVSTFLTHAPTTLTGMVPIHRYYKMVWNEDRYTQFHVPSGSCLHLCSTCLT